MKYYLIAGEASGDLHGANLMKALLENDADAEFFIFGGDKMSAIKNTSLRKHISEMSFMGFVEVLMNLNTINKNMNYCKQDILKVNPDVVILIDFPGFNLRIAEYAKLNSFKVFYYISPKIWAWNTKRVHKIKKFVDRVYAILPFEKEFYRKYDCEVEYIGNPLKDSIANYSYDSNFKENNNVGNKPILAILPGSRKMELQKIFPEMIEAAKRFDDYQVVVAAAGNLPLEYYQQFDIPANFKLIYNQTYDILNNAELAIVTSGTATLETALFKVPQVVCYKANTISVAIARMLVKIKFISLVNLIADRKIVTELIQEDCTADKIHWELNRLRKGESDLEIMLKNYDELIEKVGEPGASNRAALSMVNNLKKL